MFERLSGLRDWGQAVARQATGHHRQKWRPLLAAASSNVLAIVQGLFRQVEIPENGR